MAKSVPTIASCCAPLRDVRLTEADADVLAKQFAALADPVRLRLLSVIANSDEVCSCNMLELVGKSQPTVSHHTRVLAEANLIEGEKRGRWVYWRAIPQELEALRKALS